MVTSELAAGSGFYDADEASRLAGVSRGQLRYWNRKGIIGPDVEVVDIDGATSQGYSFEFLVYISLLRRLRERGYSLEESVRGLKHLRDRLGPPSPAWFNAKLAFEHEGLVAFKQDEWGATVATLSGQRLAEPVVAVDFAEIGNRLDALVIPERFRAFIEISPSIHSGRPIVRGTRITTSLVSRLARNGSSIEEIQRSYPVLSTDQICAAIAFETELDSLK